MLKSFALPLFAVIAIGPMAQVPCRAADRVLDDFDYADTAAARRAWRTMPADIRVEPVQRAGQSALRVAVPFADRPELDRVYLDRAVKLDLAAAGAIALEVDVANPRVTPDVSIYFHAQSGWYSGSAAFHRTGRQTVTIAKSAFRTELDPAGWDTVDRIRISFWNRKGKAPEDAVVDLIRLAVPRPAITVLTPTAEEAADDQSGELETGIRNARLVASLLEDEGLAADRIDQSIVAAGGLQGRRLAILAYMPRLRGTATARLGEFIDGGGKVIACFQVPPKLLAKLGFREGRYMRPDRPGRFAQMRFDAPDVAGLPTTVEQDSWNVVTMEPSADDARVIGRWHDDQGQPTGEPAVLLSPRGAAITHILLPDDREGHRRLLSALAGHLVPELWGHLARGQLDPAVKIGHTDGLESVVAFVRARNRPAASAKLDEAIALREEAQSALDEGRFFHAAELARRADGLLRAAYVYSIDGRPDEGRAVWNHSGTGAYPGDWNRSAQLLADSGFNMVFPNMLWGGVAHYASDVLPRSSTFERYGDQITQCVEACRRHGLEVHVWKVNWNLGRAPRAFIDRMRREHRLQVTNKGETIEWLCPSHPENVKLELDSMLEVARKYPVDGLHFDYIRYPGTHVCFCDGCRRRFEADLGRKVPDWPADCRDGELTDAYTQWRCDRITRLVEAVSHEAKQVRPGIDISAAVFRDYPGCRRTVAQDWVHWVEQGYLDFLCPMDYTESDIRFETEVADQLRRVGGRIPVYPGIGASASNSRLTPDRVAGQIHLAREAGAQGFTIFNFARGTAERLIPVLGHGPTGPPR